MRVVQLANLVTPTSGGIRTVVGALGRGYAERGHDRHLVRPGRRATRARGPDGATWTLPGVPVPGSGGYRVLLRRRPVADLLERLEPDVVEVSDRWTLPWVADWATARGVRSVALVHEHLAQTVAAWPGVSTGAAELVAARADARLVARFDAVVCGSRHSAGPFGDAAQVVPLGVDLARFTPCDTNERSGPARLVVVGRLATEKRPDLAIETVRTLTRRGLHVHLDVVGDGPLRRRCERVAAGLPVTFHGHVADRRRLASTIAGADVALAPCPIEAFGLAALEALACGTPVVSTGGGPADLLEPERGDLFAPGPSDLLTPASGDAGRVVSPTPDAIADAVRALASRPRAATRHAARALAETRPWSRTVDRMLDILAADRSVRA